MVDLEKKRTKEHGTVNELELILGRGAGLFVGKTVRTWKMHGIGEGRVYKGLDGYKREIEIILEGGFVLSKDNATADEASLKKGEEQRLCWTAYLTKKGKADEEPDDTDEICSRGEEIDGGTTDRGLFTCNECENHDSDEGWALKGKRKHVVYSKKAKKFAEKLFNLGDENERKMDPAEVERLMKEDDNIKPYERMNAQQIRSYFTTLCKKKKEKKSKTVRPKKAVINEYADDDSENDWSDVSDEDEENIDDFGREQDDVIHD
ncbi:hypothetical protein PMAYCL1PPCAC_15643, partial [Pristionchus mayeri]